MERILKGKLIILLIVVVLIAEASVAFAASSDEPGIVEPVDVYASDVDYTWSPAFEEPMPCTNQRCKAWFGCP